MHAHEDSGRVETMLDSHTRRGLDIKGNYGGSGPMYSVLSGGKSRCRHVTDGVSTVDKRQGIHCLTECAGRMKINESKPDSWYHQPEIPVPLP